MTTPVTFASAQTQLGLALETTRGTAVAPAYWLPIMAPKYKPDININDDKAFRGSMVEIYDIVRGQRYDGHGWDSYPYLDSFPVMLRALLGSSDNLTVGGSPTTLSAPSAVGATTLTTAATVAAGSYIVIDTGTGLLETNKVVSVAGSFTLTLAWPTIFAHASAVAVTPLSTHAFSLLNNAGSTGDQPPSVTLTDFSGDQWRQLSGCQLDSLTIKGTATGLIEYTVNWFGNPATTPSPPSASYTTAEAPPGWTSQLFIGGTRTQYFTDWEFDFKRQVKPIPAFTGNEAYLQYFAGPIQCTGKITVVEQASAPEITEYLNGTQSAMDYTLFDTGTGWALNLHSTATKWRTGEIDRSKEWVSAQLEAQLLPTATDALAGGVSPCVLAVANSQTTAYA